MVSIIKTDVVKNEEGKTIKTAQYVGLSTDTKPTEDVGNGSFFIEINTSKIYIFDSVNEQWHEFKKSE